MVFPHALMLLVATPQLPLVVRTAVRTPILTYHDMVPERDSRALWFDCTPGELEQQLDWLTRRGAHFVSIRAVEDHLTGRKALPKNAVAITFADNYQGFYNLALPILRRRRVPVTMFVHTDHVGSMRGRPKMTWSQLRELDREGLVTIASQTRSHPADLRQLGDDKLREEMAGSKRVLEQRLGHEVPYLAYPNGKFDARVARAAQSAGYRLGFTETQRPAERAPSLFTVPRYVHTKFRQAWADALER